MWTKPFHGPVKQILSVKVLFLVMITRLNTWVITQGAFLFESAHQSRRRCVLTGLVLCSLNPGLQVSRWMEVLALVSAAAAFNIVHADNDRVLAAVHHARLHWMSVTAVALAPRAVTTLEFPTNLVEYRSLLASVCLCIIPKHNLCMQAAYLQLVCTCMLVWGGAVGHGCQASGTPRDQQGSTGQQLRHQAHAWAHVVQIWTESHTGTCCQRVCHWECCLR